jgi:4-amino-4-deoxy-L-arabinose transferase-like glycosyltransferase
MQRISTKGWSLFSRPIFPVVLLVIATFVIATKDITRGDFAHTDAWSHAMNGVYLLDLIKAMPIHRFWDFTTSYFAKYPAISLPYHPPGFPLFEAILFAVMGVSAVTARFAVVLCALAAVLAWYRLVRNTHGQTVALISGFFFITNTAIVLASRQVMLEIPAIATIAISAFFLHKAVESRSVCFLYWWAISAGASVWMKQTTIFLIPLSISYFLLQWKNFRPPFKHFLAAGAIIIAELIPIWFMTRSYAHFALAQVVGGTRRYGFEKGSMADLSYYFRHLPDLVPIYILALAAVSLIIILWKKQFRQNLIYILWILWAYATASAISIKEDRYGLFLIPPLYLLACAFVDRIEIRIKGIKIVNVVLGLLCIVQCGFAYRTTGPMMFGYEEAARYIDQNWKGKAVLISAKYHGNFTFNVRKLDPQGKIMVLRAEKVLPQLVRRPDEVNQEWLDQSLSDLGIKYIIVESANWKIVPEMTRLRQLLEAGKFTLRKRIPVQGTIKGYEGVDILVYEYLGKVSSSKKAIRMMMPKMHGALTIPLQ